MVNWRFTESESEHTPIPRVPLKQATCASVPKEKRKSGVVLETPCPIQKLTDRKLSTRGTGSLKPD